MTSLYVALVIWSALWVFSYVFVPGYMPVAKDAARMAVSLVLIIGVCGLIGSALS